MSIVSVYTRAQTGMEAPLVSVEVHLGGGLPGLSIVGLVETAVRESRERVRAALSQSGFEVPRQKITVNLAPADLPKRGGRFDLAIALGILGASGQVATDQLDRYEFFGELAFTGALRNVDPLLPAAICAKRSGRRCVVPAMAADQLSLLGDERNLSAAHLIDVVRYLNSAQPLVPVRPTVALASHDVVADLADIVGQTQACRAVQIAAAGRHNILMIGPPGAGKTMLARRLPGLLPTLRRPQIIENVILQSLANTPARAMSDQPPFRAPHHTASAVALVGGGNPPRPGEISLAHNGVLFLDELPEFSRPVLEAIREPMETGRVRIARARHSVEFPARFQLIAAMNPCPCGFAGERKVDCRCTPDQVRAYQGRISGPLLDRIDIGVFLQREPVVLGDSEAPEHGSTACVRESVTRAVVRMRDRNGCPNAELRTDQIKMYCWPDLSGRRVLEKAAAKFTISRRACDSVLKVARTIADLAGDEVPLTRHVAEALQFRVQLTPKSNVSL